MMNKIIFITCTYILLIFSSPFQSASADLGNLFNSVKQTIGGGSDASEGDIVGGLKEALQIGTSNTVQALSKTDGYYKNPKLKIPLPESLQKFEKILRATGFGQKLDEFELSMNRAAELAAPEAKELFVGAIKEMTFADANKILQGANNEATVYFQNKTTDKLQGLFKPIVKHSMEKVGVIQSYKSVADQVQTLPFAGGYVVDLDSYVTEKSIEGLFVKLAEEEAKIRTDPAARVTDLLKKVFR